MVESCTFFEVTDREFDDGVVTVEGVGFNSGEIIPVGDEGVVSPFGPESELGGIGEAGAAHDESDGAELAAAGSADGGATPSSQRAMANSGRSSVEKPKERTAPVLSRVSPRATA